MQSTITETTVQDGADGTHWQTTNTTNLLGRTMMFPIVHTWKSHSCQD